MDDLTGVEVAVWGLGLIGYSLGGELARVGQRCLIADIDTERVARLNAGELPFQHLPELPHSYREEVRAGLLRATSEPAELLGADHPVHVLCIPTERAGQIDDSVLRAVVGRIATESAARPLHLVIESTIAPGWIDSIVHRTMAGAGLRHGTDYHVGASPRRDWLTAPGHTMASLPKIIGADSPAGLQLLRALYSPICTEVLEAPDARHASLVKVVENYYRYRGILLANELGSALPDYDVASVLRLAGTKWNMPEYHPSLGIGGYCVPLAKDYLAAENGLEPLAAELHAAEEKLFTDTRNALRAHGSFRTVGVLGLAYAPGMKVHTRSPTVRLAHELAGQGARVLVHDPLYSDEEIESITGAQPLRFPDGLSDCDGVVLMTGHQEYLDITPAELSVHLGTAECVVDNLGLWRGRVPASGPQYLEVGGPGFYAGGRPGRAPGQGIDRDREFLAALPVEQVAAAVRRVTSLDRRHLTLELAGAARTIPQVADHVAELLGRRVESWSTADLRLVCALYAVGRAGVRLEQVGVSAELEVVTARLGELHADYLAALARVGDSAGQTGPGAADHPWWEVADALPALRDRIDRHYSRILEIDGQSYHRRELLLPAEEFAAGALPEGLAKELTDRHPGTVLPPATEVSALLRAATLAELDRHGHPMGLLETIMAAAVADPRHPSDHATLMCPRGTRIDRPGTFEKDDFGIYVVFNPAFRPSQYPGVGDLRSIRKAMYAHHAAKKARVAKKAGGAGEHGAPPAAPEDLGARGLYVNEHAHHRGHVVAGVTTALRSLMDIDVATPDAVTEVRGLTDWRLSRAGTRTEDRYRLHEYPSFHAYGRWIKVVVETALGAGCVLPAMLGEW
ncbi:UDP binding domain-containing protein [Kitasatospora viridis]|uniref:Nucleotide sugar dehydrogenase n=1 Tax=Kitasatospora viridis TaxID=281105 RepID=A0A561T6C3_9ACTN|nr:UDP binding domain-containing protein [Kitasatospora viridis]TWF82663.1 nucleotide sugar dehydrogenase [Kitasatospora viridis]